ncbi:MAG: hypothetical protein V4603_12780 [Pseudomonadota bacterium]
MSFTPFHCRPACTLLALLALLVSACASQPERTAPLSATAEAPRHTGVLTDFSGHWEKNYQLSDDFNTRFQLYVADIQRSYSRNAEANGFNGAAGFDANAVNGLARFAEELTRMPLLDITQDTKGIDIERENDFNLRCFYEDKLYVQSTSTFGSDLCGWNDARLMFQMRLGGGLQITHQLSLSPDGAGLNIMTTVSSDLVSAPVVISNYYSRYTPPEENYDCQLTLTRNRVCSQQGGRE